LLRISIWLQRTCLDCEAPSIHPSIHPSPPPPPGLRDGPIETVQDRVFANEIAIAVHKCVWP